jgi:hypothetical protein
MIETKQARGLPAWASSLIIVVALAAGAGIVYWFFTRGPGGNEAVVLDRGPEDGVKALNGGRTWNVVSGNTTMKVSKLPGGEFQTKFGYLRYDFLAPEEFAVLTKGRRIATDAAMAEAVGLSPEQADQVKEQVRRGFNFAIADEDQKRLIELFRAWLDASATSRDGPELKLLRALDDTGSRSEASARQVTTDAVAQIQKLVTAAQWRKFDELNQ